MQIYEKLKNEISLDNMYESMEVLVNEIGERLSGTPEMLSATTYIDQRLKQYGLSSYVDTFPMYQSYPGEAELQITAPFEKKFEARPVCHIESTAEEGISGELIYLGSGAYEDYEGKNVEGKIVLTDMNWSPGRPEKARIAWEMGAKALIIMNWGKAEDKLIQMGGVKTQWGNPTPENEKEIVRLAVISISRADGEELAELCKKQKVTAWLKAEATREWITAYQPMARVKGGKSNGQYVLVGSHVDAWGKSAICNSSGNALNMELARIFHKHREELNRDVVFAFWDGHEVAECGGSTWYCDNYWAELDADCLAYINIDNLAIKGTTIPGVESLPELKEYLMEAIEKIWGMEGSWHHAYKGGGDSSFFGVGVPYISFATEYTDEKLKELNYAFYGPWLHSNADTIDKIDKNLFEKHMEYFMYILCGLTVSEIIPYKLTDMAEEIKQQYEKIVSSSGAARKYLTELEPVIEEYVRLAEKIEEAKETDKISTEKVKLLNKLALYWERQTAPFRCEAGRYGQDSCCYLQTEKPIPALEKAVGNYIKLPKGDYEYYLWETQVMRMRNRTFDALQGSVQMAKLILELLNYKS